MGIGFRYYSRFHPAEVFRGILAVLRRNAPRSRRLDDHHPRGVGPPIATPGKLPRGPRRHGGGE